MGVDWNDWRFFLAVVQHGSTLAAGRALRVSQTTVARRVAALEGALHLQLFERQPRGYRLTVAGTELLDHAKAVARSAEAIEMLAGSRQREVGGTVRITAEEIFNSALIAPLLPELHDRHPEIRIEIDNTIGLRDLAAGEADIALRSAVSPTGAGLVGRVIVQDDWALYCSLAYADRHTVPRSIEELKDHVIIGGGGGQLAREYGEWIASAGLVDRVTVQQGSASGLLAAVRSGLGIAALPCIVADSMPDLVQCAPPPGEKRRMWLLTHERVRHQPAVRTVIDFLYDHLIAHVRSLSAARGS